jgi:predicted dehydrogenase
LHYVDKTLVFNTWQELIVASGETLNTIGKRLADAVIIAVHDHQHTEVTKAFAEQGYYVLCEKLMTTSVQDCVEMENVIKKSGRIFGMGPGACFCLE